MNRFNRPDPSSDFRHKDKSMPKELDPLSTAGNIAANIERERIRNLVANIQNNPPKNSMPMSAATWKTCCQAIIDEIGE